MSFYNPLSLPPSLSHDIGLSLSQSSTGKAHFWNAQSQEGAETNVLIALNWPLLLFKEHVRPKRRVLTEGMAGIFNDLPQAHSKQQIFYRSQPMKYSALRYLSQFISSINTIFAT